MMDRDKLQAAVDAKWVPVYASSKADIVAYYRDKYGSDTSKWATQAAKDMYNANPGLYKNVKNARRNFEGGREDTKASKSAKGKAQWANMGKQLPPVGKKLPDHKLTLTVKGTQYEKGGDRERSFTTTFKGPDAYSFANSPTYHSFFHQGFDYPDGVIERFDGGDSSALEVTSVA